MTFLDKLERRFGRYAINNLSLWIIGGQAVVFVLALMKFPVANILYFPQLVLEGEVWRAFTFILQPDGIALGELGEPILTTSPLWILIGWYLFRLFGGALEREWGEFRFNLFILIGVVCTVIAGLFNVTLFPPEYRPEYLVGNFYLMTSVFIAFAILFPNFELHVFFVLPVKVKWLALIFVMGWALSARGLPHWTLILAALVNIGIFFGPALMRGAQARQRRQQFDAERKAEQEEAFHKCVVCGKTDNDDPDMEFAYKDGQGYCKDHWAEMDRA